MKRSCEDCNACDFLRKEIGSDFHCAYADDRENIAAGGMPWVTGVFIRLIDDPESRVRATIYELRAGGLQGQFAVDFIKMAVGREWCIRTESLDGEARLIIPAADEYFVLHGDGLGGNRGSRPKRIYL